MADDLDTKRLRELALRAAHSDAPRFTRFLEPAMLDAVRFAAGQAGVGCTFWGGYPDAERVMAAFHRGDPPEPKDFPLKSVWITWNPKFADPGHRDLLGATMGLGIERDASGDIAMGEADGRPCACLFAAEEMADYIAANLESAGRASVKCHVADEPPAIVPPEGTQLRVTVQQPRLDAVLAAGWNLSRSEAQRLISAGLVKLNHVPNLHTDAKVGEGDLISARGHGRLKVLSWLGESRRGRLALSLFRYGGRK